MTDEEIGVLFRRVANRCVTDDQRAGIAAIFTECHRAREAEHALRAERMADVLAELASRAAANRADAFPQLYPQKGKQ